MPAFCPRIRPPPGPSPAWSRSSAASPTRATLEVKELAIVRYDGTYSRDINILKALLGFAGMDKQAERVRPKVRKRRPAEGSGLPEEDPVVEVDENDDEVAVVDPDALPERVNAEGGATPTEPAETA